LSTSTTETLEPDSTQVSLVVPDGVIEEAVRRVASLLLPRTRTSRAPESPWLTFEQARGYLGFSRDQLYKLTAARAIPCRKKLNGQGLRFHRDELDSWMDAEYPRLDHLP
jgi:excisionase family DNA binding protein